MSKKISLSVVAYNEGLRNLSSSFSCGNLYIDNFFKSNNSLESDICKTFVMIKSTIDESQITEKIVGFYSIATDSVYSIDNSLPQNTIIYNGGAIRIHMFAIDEKYQHKSLKINNEKKTYASILLLDCLEQIDHIVEKHVGATYIILNSTQAGYALYKNIGDFEKLTEDDDIYLSDSFGNENCIPMYKYIKNDFY